MFARLLCRGSNLFPIGPSGDVLKRFLVMLFVIYGATSSRFEIVGAETIDAAAIEAKRPACEWLVLEADPGARRRLVARIEAAGGVFPTVVEPGPRLSNGPDALGEGCYVASPVLFSSHVRIGRHAIVGPNVILAHDCSVGDFVTIHASASVAGHVVIEDDVVLEAGSIVPNGRPDRPLVIGRGARVRTGAVVMRSVPAGADVRGNPGKIFHDWVPSQARPLDRSDIDRPLGTVSRARLPLEIHDL